MIIPTAIVPPPLEPQVILERDSEEVEVLRNAVELAVMSTLSHPNIVQVGWAPRGLGFRVQRLLGFGVRGSAAVMSTLSHRNIVQVGGLLGVWGWGLRVQRGGTPMQVGL